MKNHIEPLWSVLPPPPDSFFDEYPELPKTVAHLLYHRNIRTQKKIDEFLNPDYPEDIHDPFLFQDMKKATDRLFRAMEQNEKITIHGDYDADGVSASVILTSLFRAFQFDNFNVFLPHRETDGYGLNKKTIGLLADEGTNVIITCDCGISNREEVALANEKGIDVIITDHHTLPEIIPDAYAIIHPKREGETYPDKTLAGGGVAFKLVEGMLKKHKTTHTLLPNGETHEALEKWLLDMVAIASVADMVPLLGESRTLTKYGLIVLNKTRRIGLQKLLLEARLMQEDGTKKREISADTIGFQIAPRINAAGRMNHANVAYNLLVTESPTDAIDLAFELNHNNQERQELVDVLIKEAVAQVEHNTSDQPFVFVIGDDWPTGVIGLIASRLKERYYKPVLAMSQQTNEVVGSGRSIEGFDMIATLQEIPHFFSKFGGHPMACGLTLTSPDVLSEFQETVTTLFLEKTTDEDRRPILEIDAEIMLDDVQWELYDILEKFKPFGQANPKPKYVAKGVTVVGIEPVGKTKQHLRLMVQQHSPKIRKTIGWGLCDENQGGKCDWSKRLKRGDKIDMIFEIDVNEWNGNRELQLTIVDLKQIS